MAVAPKLDSERLSFRPSGPWGESDTMALQAGWLNDPEIVKYSEQRHMVHTTQTQLAYHKRVNASFGDYFWEIQYLGTPIGSITGAIDYDNRVADLGILLGEKSAWGKGLGTEAWQKISDWFLDTKVRKIEAGCMSLNVAMLKVCKRTGMALEGGRPKHFLLDDTPVDVVYYGRFR